MALEKDIEQENGVALRYHRVASVTHVTNVQTTVEVASYTSAAKRAGEKAALAAGEAHDVYVGTAFLSPGYDPSMGVDEAYAWLKSLDEFGGAEDC